MERIFNSHTHKKKTNKNFKKKAFDQDEYNTFYF